MTHKPFVPQKSDSHRPARFAARIKEELSLMIPGELSDPRLKNVSSIVITDVRVSGDLKNATVLFSLSGDDATKVTAKNVTACLNDAAGFLRNELRSKLDSRVTPLLAFKYDKGPANAAGLESLLKEAREKDEASRKARDGEE
jgi:ribosome-binding factor A